MQSMTLIPQSNLSLTNLSECYLINFKIVDMTLKPKKKTSDFYNASIIQYYPIAQNVMDSVAKIYLYQTQQNKNIIEECFEKYENSDMMKMSKNVKDLKINTFDIYEYLKKFKLYPYTGYSLFYTKKDNSKIALINVSKTLFGYYTYNIIVKWNIVKIKLYIDVISNTSTIIKHVAESIFQYTAGTADEKEIKNHADKDKVDKNHKSDKTQKVVDKTQKVVDKTQKVVDKTQKVVDKTQKVDETQKVVDNDHQKIQQIEIVSYPNNTNLTDVISISSSSSDEHKDPEQHEKHKKTIGFLEKIKKFLVNFGKKHCHHHKNNDDDLHSSLKKDGVIDIYEEYDDEEEDELNLEENLLAIATDEMEVELVKSLILFTSQKLFSESQQQQQQLDNPPALVNVNENHDYIKFYDIKDDSTKLEKLDESNKVDDVAIVHPCYTVKTENNNNEVIITAYQSVVNELCAKFNQINAANVNK